MVSDGEGMEVTDFAVDLHVSSINMRQSLPQLVPWEFRTWCGSARSRSPHHVTYTLCAGPLGREQELNTR